jgi:uncharacterized protein (TIGR02646 family)
VIHVDRSRMPAPPVLQSDRAQEARDKAGAFFAARAPSRAQELFHFDSGTWLGVKRELMELFSGKCAFCEGKFASADFHVEHFRPKSGTLNFDGRVDADYYWWLAYQWENLYLACSFCNVSKGSRFPVRTSRAPFRTSGAELIVEGPLLLDPCIDEPESELVFLSDGRVTSDTERGNMTIEVFQLNRVGLVEGRRRAYMEMQEALRSPSLSTVGRIEDDLRSMLDSTREYAAAHRQFFVQLWRQMEPLFRGLLQDLMPEDSYRVTAALRQRAKKSTESFRSSHQEFSVARGSTSQSYFLTSRAIERVEIHNFRVIRHLELEFPQREGAWLALLGENGTGKSSVLQAVALTLIGASYREQLSDRLDLDPSRVLRHGAKSGRVRVWLNGLDHPAELTFSTSGGGFGGTGEPRTLVAGYGATRLLPRGQWQPASSPRYADVGNLFNPFEPLADAEAWLLQLDDGQFDDIAKVLKTILPLGHGDRLEHWIDRDGRRRIRARLFGSSLTLDELSDGYQSVIALTIDVMKVFQDLWQKMAGADGLVVEGVVLVDELGAHLHPRWKMRIVESLRAVFPRVQFLVTTHDPLCLRGLENGEVAVLRRDARNDVFAVTDLPAVKGLAVDQLLMSEHFGLDSTVDPDVDELFQEYYRLKGMTSRTVAEEERLGQLTRQVDAYRSLGSSRQERLMLEAIDEWAARERLVAEPRRRAELREETKRRVEDIWAGLPADTSAE